MILSRITNLKVACILVLLAFLIQKNATAQGEIPLGTWRLHVSYNSIHNIAAGDNKIFGAAESGILVLNQEDNSLTTYSKLNGLSGGDIGVIGFDDQTDKLLVSYVDGDLDIIHNNSVMNFDRLKNSTTITGSRMVNNISFREGLAYLAADYGLVVFDMDRQEVKETWRDLGENGETIRIMQSAFRGDSIFLATEAGVLAGNLNDNLLDYNNWKRYASGIFSGPVTGVAVLNDVLYAAADGDGLYSYENGTWTKENFLQNVSFISMMASSSELLITEGQHVWQLTTPGSLTEIGSSLITAPQFAIAINNVVWIGDSSNGLLSGASSNFTSYIPNGPAFSSAMRLRFVNDRLYALRGGYTTALQPLNYSGEISYFSSGQWSSVTPVVRDVTDIAYGGEKPFVASFGQGIQVGEVQAPDVVYDEDNSSLVNLNPPGDFVEVTALQYTPEGIWAANYGTPSSLHRFDTESNMWQPFSFGYLTARYPLELSTDYYGDIWASLNPSQGGGILVFNPETNASALLTDAPGAGGLPSRNVYAMAPDRDGYMWIGTDKGIAYFINPANVFNPVDAIRPIFENRYLLTDEKVTAIAVDGGNRKWIGTERGVWLFNPTGEELVYNFTAENSPLLSSVIRDIGINPESGEVFFATDRGIASFRSDASIDKNFKAVKIFPNPVTSDFSGLVGISGLGTDSVVKITDISGKLIWQTQSNGGTATWNVRDYNGRRASTGIYLVFSALQDGSESFVGKIAVVE